MIFSWFKRRRRRRLLATPFPHDWRRYLEQNVSHYGRLRSHEKALLCDAVRIFMAEKRWEGCGGLDLNDEMKVTIAGQACLLLLGLKDQDHDYFGRLDTILVYPNRFAVPSRQYIGGGVVAEYDAQTLGQAWHGGPVVLSWADALSGGRDEADGRNLVLHEFAHKLDFLDHIADGTPPLDSSKQYDQWRQVMTEEFDDLIESANKHRKTLLDKYGATDEAEFFAVATECFFERPNQMQQQHPRLYDLLRGYYNQDPATRFGPDAR